MATGWRIVKSRHAGTAFDGEGARLYGGRWNTPGTGMIYTSSSTALAALEVLVHLNQASLLSSYSLCAAHFGDNLVERLDRSKLPDGWRAYPAPPELQEMGDAWVRGGASAVLEVPSAVVEHESNYLINPAHPDFATINIGAPESFGFDTRLMARFGGEARP